MDATTERLTQRMRARRRELGLTQDQVARRTDLSLHRLASIETGRRKAVSITEVIAIAEALEIDLTDLIEEPAS